MKQKNGKKFRNQLFTKWWEAREESKDISTTLTWNKNSTLKRKSTFITEEKAPPTGFKFSVPTLPSPASVSVELKRTFASSLNQSHSSFIKYTDWTSNNLLSFCTTLWEDILMWSELSFQEPSLTEWSVSTSQDKLKFGSMRTSEWTIQDIITLMPSSMKPCF